MLYQTVAEHWPAFLERAEEHGGLPRFTPSGVPRRGLPRVVTQRVVVKEFEEYLGCGQLERGKTVTY